MIPLMTGPGNDNEHIALVGQTALHLDGGLCICLMGGRYCVDDRLE
jgi:hypothetical protein